MRSSMGGCTADAVIEIVACAFVAVAEDVVRRRDRGKAFGCFGVGAVSVWVVFEGEGVELPVPENR